MCLLCFEDKYLMLERGFCPSWMLGWDCFVSWDSSSSIRRAISNFEHLLYFFLSWSSMAEVFSLYSHCFRFREEQLPQNGLTRSHLSFLTLQKWHDFAGFLLLCLSNFFFLTKFRILHFLLIMESILLQNHYFQSNRYWLLVLDNWYVISCYTSRSSCSLLLTFRIFFDFKLEVHTHLFKVFYDSPFYGYSRF